MFRRRRTRTAPRVSISVTFMPPPRSGPSAPFPRAGDRRHARSRRERGRRAGPGHRYPGAATTFGTRARAGRPVRRAPTCAFADRPAVWGPTVLALRWSHAAQELLKISTGKGSEPTRSALYRRYVRVKRTVPRETSVGVALVAP